MTNYISNLFTKMRKKDMKPPSALEALATNAEELGFIDSTMHRMLQDLIPFQGFRRSTHNEVRRRFHMTIEEFEKLKSRAYAGLLSYVDTFEDKVERNYPRPAPNSHSEITVPPVKNLRLDVDLDSLPWLDNPASTRAIKALLDHFGRMPSARESLEWLNKMAEERTSFSHRNFGRAAGRAICEAYRGVGEEAPIYNYQLRCFLKN